MSEIEKYKEKIYFVKDQFVMLDVDVAEFFQVEVRVLNQARQRKALYLDPYSFQLTENEWNEILVLRGEKKKHKNLPFVYTKKGANKMAFVLDSKTALEVSDLILDVFMSVQEGRFVPAVKDNKNTLLEKKMVEYEKELTGKNVIINHFHAPVTINQNMQTGVQEEVLYRLVELLTIANRENVQGLQDLTTKAISDVIAKDKKGLSDKIKDMLDFASKASEVAQKVGSLVELISKLPF